jgi:hypothetical protein
MRNFLIFFILPSLFISWSCKKKSESPASRPLLMTIDVAGNYFNPVLGGVIFISDMQGKVLADTFCLTDGKYQLYGQAGTAAPSALEVSTVRSEPYWHSFKIVIETYTYIQASELKFQGYRQVSAGEVNPVYINVPTLSDAILISSSGYSNLTSVLTSLPILLFKSPDDIYFGLPTSAGMRYKWFSGVQAGTMDTFDLSNSLVPEKKTVSFSSPVQYYECRVQGFPDGNFNSPIPIMLDEILSTGTTANSVDVYYLPSKFQGFHTDIMSVESWASNQTWYYHIDGQIPPAFRKIAANLASYTSTNTQLVLKALGDLDAVSGTWQFQNPYKGQVEWTVFGPDSATVLQLPQVAPAMNNMFPWFSKDSLTFGYVQLIDLVNCQGYSQMINLLYNPANPSNFDRQETSILSVTPSGK